MNYWVRLSARDCKLWKALVGCGSLGELVMLLSAWEFLPDEISLSLFSSSSPSILLLLLDV